MSNPVKSEQQAHTSQRGIAHIAVVLGLIVLAVVAFAAYYVASQNKDTDQTAQTSTAPEAIESQADLQQASDTLDQDENDDSLDPDQLDDDINTLL